jgi:hypothetical protein
MADPLKYFFDSKERELVSQVWSLAGKKTEFFSTICKVNQYYFASPDAKRTLHAKDWMTYYRQDGAREDNDTVNRQLGHPPGYYSGEAIADVEHFFVAAFMHVAIGPAITQVGIVGWETFDTLLKRPLMNAMHAYNHNQSVGKAFYDGFPSGLRGWFNSARWNYGQAVRAQSGIAFASELIEGKSYIPVFGDIPVTLAQATANLRAAVDFVKRAIPAPPKFPNFGDAPAGICPIPPKPGIPDKEFVLNFADPQRRSLSAIAKLLYGGFELWPLLWWHNPQISNPNRLKGLRSIRYRDKHTYSTSDLQAARQAAPSWKNFPM